MNEARRKKIAQAIGMIEEAKGILEECAFDERDYFDNLPENMQGGEKGEKAEQAADALDEAVNVCDEIVSTCETAME